MSLFQNYRLFLGLYSKNIATFWDLGDWRGTVVINPRLDLRSASI